MSRSTRVLAVVTALAVAAPASSVADAASHAAPAAHVAKAKKKKHAAKRGPKGAHGAKGVKGAKGRRGRRGRHGVVGPTGAHGASGTNGGAGTQGPAGAQGAAGADGSAGTQGSAGSQGAAGQNGSTGAQGTTGRTGSTGPQGGTSVVARPRFTGSVGTGGAEAGAKVALTPPGWTQLAGENDHVVGQATFLLPAKCDDQTFGNDPTTLPDPLDPTGGFSFPGNAYGDVVVDGREVGYLQTDSYDSADAGKPQTVDLQSYNGSADFFEPDAATSHAITVTVGDSCAGTGQEYKVTSVKLDVLGTR